MSRHTRMIYAAAMFALFATPLQAVEIFWQGTGVTGNLTDPNWSDGVNTNLAPTANDILDFGGGGTATYSVAGPASFQKLRVGHGQTTPGGVGTGTVTINNGAQVTLTVGATGNANASLWVGNLQTGRLDIDGPGTSLTAAQILMIGYGNNLNRSGTVNVTNGAALNNLAGNVNIGDRTAGVGLPGHLNISGSGSIFNMSGSGGDLNIGIWAPSTYSQTDGTVTIADTIILGQRNADGSSFSMSGGTLTTGGQISASTGTVAEGYSDNVSVSFSGTAVANLGGNITVGSADSRDASLTIAGTADVNIPGTGAAGNIFIGRGTSSNTTFTMTGGTADLGNHFLMGTGATPGATGILGTHSGGTITTVNNFVLADSFGSATYNLSAAGTINANGLVIVGRQNGTGVMNQTGGSVTAALGVTVGNAQNATTTVWGTGTYNVSAGTITANQTTGPALSIAPQGTGIFRVTGDDAVIDVNGNMTVNAGGSAQGTLAFQLETGDLLSLIDVSGTARFNKGAMLVLDDSLAAPTQTSYDLLTAPIIADIGISFSGPAGWGYRIVSGGNGKILRVGLGLTRQLPGDHNDDGVVDAADYVQWRKDPDAYGGSPGGYDAYRQNFGDPFSSGSSLSGAQVPEPASALLCYAAVAGLMFARRR